MSGKKPSAPPRPKVARKSALAEAGLRVLKPAELTKLGFSAGSRRYVEIGKRPTKTNTLARRAAEQKYALGGKKFEKLGPRGKMRSYSNILHDYAQANFLSMKDARKSDDLKDIIKLLAKIKRDRKRGIPIDRSPFGPLARILVALGRRDEEADWEVGETPDTLPNKK